LFKFKEGENFNHRNTLSILRIKLKLHCVQNVEPDIPPMAGGKRGRFAKVSGYPDFFLAKAASILFPSSLK
jgi:hypothetical protein